MSDSSFNTDWPLAWLFLGFIISLGVAFFYYYKDKRFRGVANYWLYLMGFLRFAAFMIIFVLLLGVNFKQTTEQKEPPVVVVVQDNSSSVVPMKDSVKFKTEYLSQLNTVSNAIGNDFEIVNYHFDGTLKDNFSTGVDGKSTNIGNVFSTLRKKYTNRNLGAIVLATDGNYNKGVQPMLPLEKMPFVPIYAIALGDTVPYKDTRIVDVEHNEVAFYQNSFPVKVFLEAHKIDAPQTVTISCWSGREKLFSTPVEWKSEDDFKTVEFQLKADELGVKQLEVRLDTLEGESSVQNNVRSFYIEVVDARQSVLIASQAPHPDISTIYQSILKKKGYEVEMVIGGRKPNKAISTYDLVILHTPQNKTLDKQILADAKSLWIIAAPGSEFPLLNQLSLGFTMTSVRGEDNIFPGFNNNFSAFQIDEKINSLSPQLPPLMAPYGKLSVGAGAKVIAQQRLGNIVKNDPLWFVTQQGERKVGVLLGEGIWRWRLYNQKLKSTTEDIEKLIGQWAQFLALKTNKTRFRVQANTTYSDQDQVELFAELFDDAFERTTNGVVVLEVSGQEYDRTFTMVNYADRFKSNLGQMSPGEYKWKATAEFNGKKYSKEGRFVVKRTYLEQSEVKANHQLLRNMAVQSNGAVVGLSDAGQISAMIRENADMATVVHEKFSWKDLLEQWWWMLIIALLFFTEWFLRKRLGAI